MADCVSSQSKRKTTQFPGKCVWIIVFYFLNIFLTMYFITNGYKCFSKTNSTDPRQRVLLKSKHFHPFFPKSFRMGRHHFFIGYEIKQYHVYLNEISLFVKMGETVVAQCHTGMYQLNLLHLDSEQDSYGQKPDLKYAPKPFKLW